MGRSKNFPYVKPSEAIRDWYKLPIKPEMIELAM